MSSAIVVTMLNFLSMFLLGLWFIAMVILIFLIWRERRG